MITREALKAFDSLLRRVVRVGSVVAVLDDRGTVRVEFDELSRGKQTYELAVLQSFTFRDKAYLLPDVGEQVICLFYPWDSRKGVVLGSIYSSRDGVPVGDRDVRCIHFEDGTRFEYDRKTKQVYIHSEGDILIECSNLTVDTPGTVLIKCNQFTVQAIGIDLLASGITMQADSIAMNAGEVAVTAGTFTVTAVSTFNGTVTVVGLLTAGGGLAVTGAISATGAITASGAMTAGSITSSGPVNAPSGAFGSLTVAGVPLTPGGNSF